MGQLCHAGVLTMNYEEAVKIVRRSAVAVSSAYLALIVLDVTIMASSLPYVYVSDPAANCGARYLVSFASHYIFQSGLSTLAAAAIAQLYSGWISGRKLSYTLVGPWGKATLSAVTLAFGLLSIYFFASAGRQLMMLGDPPRLPGNFDKTHLCLPFPEPR